MDTYTVIPFAPDYEISESGAIRRITQRSGTQSGKILKAMRNPFTGYSEVALRVNGKTIRSRIHRVMARVFFGDQPLEVNHKNGDKSDNRICNLEYVTRAENAQHAKHVINAYWSGSAVPQSKLTETDIAEIWALRESGFSFSQIAQAYSVNHVSILNIIHGKTWRRVSVQLGKLA